MSAKDEGTPVPLSEKQVQSKLNLLIKCIFNMV